MPRIPGLPIAQDTDVAGAVPQQSADVETFAPGWRQVDSAIRTGGDVDREVFGAQAREMSALGNVGDAIDEGAGYLHRREVQQEISRNNAALAEGRLQWTQHLTDKLANPPRDANGSIQYQDLTQGLLDDFDKYADGMLEGANTREGRDQLRTHLAEMRTQFGEQAMVGQAHLAGVQHLENFNRTSNALTSATRLLPSSAATNIAQGFKAIEAEFGAGDMGAEGPAKAAEARTQFAKSIVQSAYAGQIENDPATLSKQLNLPADARTGWFKDISKFSNGDTDQAFKDAADRQVKSLEDDKRRAHNDELQRQAENQAKNFNKGAMAFVLGNLSETPQPGKVSIQELAQSQGLTGGEILHLQSVLKVQADKGLQLKSDPATNLKGFDIARDDTLSVTQKLKAIGDLFGKGLDPNDYSFLSRVAQQDSRQDNPYFKQLDLEAKKKLLDSPTGQPKDPGLVDGYVEFQRWAADYIDYLRSPDGGSMKLKDILAPDGPIRSVLPSFRSDVETKVRLKAQDMKRNAEWDAMRGRINDAVQVGMAVASAPDRPMFGLSVQSKPGLSPVADAAPDDYPKKQPGESIDALMARIQKYKAGRK